MNTRAGGRARDGGRPRRSGRACRRATRVLLKQQKRARGLVNHPERCSDRAAIAMPRFFDSRGNTPPAPARWMDDRREEPPLRAERLQVFASLRECWQYRQRLAGNPGPLGRSSAPECRAAEVVHLASLPGVPRPLQPALRASLFRSRGACNWGPFRCLRAAAAAPSTDGQSRPAAGSERGRPRSPLPRSPLLALSAWWQSRQRSCIAAPTDGRGAPRATPPVVQTPALMWQFEIPTGPSLWMKGNGAAGVK